MILVVSPNLAVDVTLEVDAIEPGEVHRARRVRRQAGGKGVNFARALRSLGPLGLPDDPPLVVGFASGRAGETIREGLDEERIDCDLVSFPGESRTCTIVLDLEGEATVVNEAGPPDRRRFASSRGIRISPRRVARGRLHGKSAAGLPARPLCRDDRARERSRPVVPSRYLGRSLAPRSRRRAESREAESTRRRKSSWAFRFRATALDERESSGFGASALRREWSRSERQGSCSPAKTGVYRSASAASSDLRLGNPTGAGDALAAGLLAGVMRGYPLSESARLAAAAAAASLAEGYGRFRAKDVRVEAVTTEKI